MSKISYIVVPQHEVRKYAELSNRVIANAIRLLVAVILMSALVAIIVLAAHRAVDVQPVQPWTLAPAPAPSTVESPQPSVILERRYILCMSELSNRSSDLKWGKLSKTENRVMQTALDVFKQCAVIKVKLDVGKELRQPNVSTNFNRCFGDHYDCRIRDRRCQRYQDLPESKPKLVEYLEMRQQSVPVYSTNDEQIFYGSPFLSTWQDLFDNDDDVLDRCIRLMLIWRYGGLACNLEEATEELLQDFKHLLDNRDEPVILTEDYSVVYSRRSCHAAIGTMLVDYAKFSVQLPNQESRMRSEVAREQEKKIMQHAEELFDGSVYFAMSPICSLPVNVDEEEEEDHRPIAMTWPSDIEEDLPIPVRGPVF